MSLVLLILSSADNGLLGEIVKLCWLASVAALTLTNIGAAFGAYVSSLAIYAVIHVGTWSSPFERPDNYALVILLAGAMRLVISRRSDRSRFSLYIWGFLLFVALHAIMFGGFSWVRFAVVARWILIPFLCFALLANAELCERELHAIRKTMFVLGSYIGLVSILERLYAYDWILPPWVGDPSLNEYLDFPRSGGTLLQPTYNGLLLSLIFWVLLFSIRRDRARSAMVPMALCVVGVFLSYCRAAWLGLVLSLMWLPGWCRSLRHTVVRRAALMCIVVLLTFAAGDTASTRLHDSGTVLFRFSVWGAGLRLVTAHPLLGIGFANFGNEMMKVEQGFGALLPTTKDVKDGDAPHNTPLTVLVESGILGFFLYAAALLEVVRKAKTNAFRIWGRPAAAWVIAFAVVYIVNAQFATTGEPTINALFFGFLGGIAGART